jgi:imidazoleglycerol phosphate dehydratase HisB
LVFPFYNSRLRKICPKITADCFWRAEFLATFCTSLTTTLVHRKERNEHANHSNEGSQKALAICTEETFTNEEVKKNKNVDSLS